MSSHSHSRCIHQVQSRPLGRHVPAACGRALRRSRGVHRLCIVFASVQGVGILSAVLPRAERDGYIFERDAAGSGRGPAAAAHGGRGGRHHRSRGGAGAEPTDGQKGPAHAHPRRPHRAQDGHRQPLPEALHGPLQGDALPAQGLNRVEAQWQQEQWSCRSGHGCGATTGADPRQQQQQRGHDEAQRRRRRQDRHVETRHG